MRSDLQRLKRDTDSDRSALLVAPAGPEGSTGSASSARHSATHAASGMSNAPQRSFMKIGLALAVIAVVVFAAVGWFFMHRSLPPAATAVSQKTIAVLPLQNLGGDKELDFLKLALADEIATSLSYVRTLSIRPFATTSKYDSPTLDLQEAGHAMHVTDVVTGHYLKEGSQLQITFEAIDVADNRTVWRDTMTVAAPDMIAMRGQITAKVRQGLLPALGAGADSAEGTTRPKNEEAYDLYLRSIAMPDDPQPNKEAIAMLERAVGLDPTYAPAWAYLGIRYHYDGAYSNGGDEMRKRSDAALERALRLDPDFVFADSWLITNWVERNELARAYQAAKALAARHPESAAAHFALAYVLRYGGAVEESARECDTGLSADPGNFTLRSCVFTFDQLGNYERGEEFLQLDAGSEWSASNMIRHYFRDGKLAQAREALRAQTDRPWSRFMTACATDPSSANAASLSEKVSALYLADPDAEVRFIIASDLSFCGQKQLALRMLKSSIDGTIRLYRPEERYPVGEATGHAGVRGDRP